MAELGNDASVDAAAAKILGRMTVTDEKKAAAATDPEQEVDIDGYYEDERNPDYTPPEASEGEEAEAVEEIGRASCRERV